MFWLDKTARAGYCTTLPRLLSAARYFQTHPDGLIKTGMWTDPAWTRADWRRWFTDCLHAKINRTDTRPGRRRARRPSD